MKPNARLEEGKELTETTRTLAKHFMTNISLKEILNEASSILIP